MLMIQPSQTPPGGPQGEWFEPPGRSIDLSSILAMTRRQIWVFVAVTCLSLAVGVAYILLAEPQYTAASSILIDTRATRAVEGASGPSVLGSDKSDNYIDNQVEVIKSDSIALAVVRKLDLTNNRLFLQDSLMGLVIKAVTSVLNQWFNFPMPAAPTGDALRMTVVLRLQTGLDVHRVPNTSVIAVNYTLSDPALAARIAQAYASAYLENQYAAREDTSNRARAWLEERIEELSRKSLEAGLAIQRFRTENNLVSAGGKLITDQQLSELNTQLTLARAETARMQARYLRIQDILDAGRTDALVGAALEDTVINGLRSKFLDAAKREAEISSRLGPDHTQAVSLREEMRQYDKLILAELKRIADSYRNDFEVAKAREQSLKDGLASLAGVSAAENVQTLKLGELERREETLRILHRSLLQRVQEANQLESFPIAEARIITDAATPLIPSYPRKVLTLAVSLIGGAMLGAGLGLLRDFGDHSLRTGMQIRDIVGTEFLGNLPQVAPAMERAPPDRVQLAEEREFHSPPMMRYVAQAPLSSYAETLRGVKVAADLSLQDGASKVIGVTSVLTDEGKSTTAKNFASLLALQGARTLLIDADLRNPGLTSAITPLAEGGLVEALLAEASLNSLILRETDTGLLFLPASGNRRLTDTSNLLTSARMRDLLRWARERFDYVVLDLPPLGPVVDVRAAAPLLSGLLVVVEWGRTPRKLVREMVLSDKIIRDCCLGIVFNKVNTKILSKYEQLGSRQRESYRRYYYDA
ncbi:Wzz/FepE/Etk N-terminal domain-containing protein [Microvirga terricola]|uniref:non-specific protein-tyrosine kinase n=1 Tax=Microvirga terricola TaxID=2719797 RepID=A0ABX0VE28_9HYPH|nr:Wzz/FepE/Etk N-terminal domain-containing protein [Microvirga terricola]NIX78083.1 AAA family ATPase [Microvirga terricola]